MNQTSLDGMTAIITGGSSGIGRATALELARGGARGLALAARSTAGLEETAAEIERLGCPVLALPTDVTRPDQVETLIAKTLARWGRVDVLVANAGQYIRSPVSRLTAAVIERSMAVNFYGAVHAVLAVLPAMRAAGRGHIVLVASMDAKKGVPQDTPYVAAKYALSGFGDTLRQELRGSGISVTTVYPGRVDTPMIAGLRVPPVSAKIAPEKVARAIVGSIRRPRAEVILPAQARLLYALHVVSPLLADHAVRLFHLEGWEDHGGTQP